MTTSYRKRKERELLASRVELSSLEMALCSYCEKHNKDCVVSSDSSKCSECIRSKRKCDVEGPSTKD